MHVDDDTLLTGVNYIGPTPATCNFFATFLNKLPSLVFRRRQQHDYRILILPDHGPREKSRACAERKNQIPRNPIPYMHA